VADLFKAELEDLGVDLFLKTAGSDDVCLAKIKVGL
jgi:hypothetical protein